MKQIKLFDIELTNEDSKITEKILKSKFWATGSSSGNVLDFENNLRDYVSSKSIIAVNSGTAALNLALSMLDIVNKEVILPSLSFVSTAHSIVVNGGIPRFVEVDEETLCIDPEEIKKNISKKTAAVIPVHFGGISSNLKKISEICKSNSIIPIEDAAHAIGTKYQSKFIGSHSNFVCFSFHPTKNLPTPSGGAISINTKNWKIDSKILSSKRWCGISNRKNKLYDVNILGWNYYMNEFSAGIGNSQLKKLNKNVIRRKEIAKKYSENICLDKKMPFISNTAYHFYWIRVKNQSDFIKKMADVGIETGIHYKPIHRFKYYSKSTLEISEKIGNEIISLPCHQNLSDEDVEKIIKFVNHFSK